MKTHPLAGLRRPRILISTARDVRRRSNRKSDLRRLMKVNQNLLQSAVIRTLKQRESEAEAMRLAQDGAYNARQHVQILAALLAECQGLKSDKTVGH